MESTSIYIPNLVHDLQHFYGDLLVTIGANVEVRAHLERIALRLHRGILEKNKAVLSEINNYHSDYLGTPLGSLLDLQLGKDVAYTTIANEYGFASWELVEHLDTRYEPLYENALSSMLAGETTKLQKLLNEHPNLALNSSPYGHAATLLHYAGSNGVELWRQQVPINIVAIVKLLLQAGAEKEALMHVYGGKFTAYTLAESSAHPFDAGVAPELLEVLK